MMIINPGSEVTGGTYKDAREEAERLLECMTGDRDGLTDIVLLDEYREDDGRFEFTYKHTITGKTGTWNITGLEQNYKEKGYIFHPRIYWNGSSCSNPEWTDFLTDEYELTVRKKETT